MPTTVPFVHVVSTPGISTRISFPHFSSAVCFLLHMKTASTLPDGQDSMTWKNLEPFKEYAEDTCGGLFIALFTKSPQRSHFQ